MFEFTTLTIYNNITVKTDAQVKAGAKANVITSTDSKTPAIRIGNTRFNAADIASISVKNPTPEFLAEVEFDLSKVLLDPEGEIEETTGRIALYLGLSGGSQDSLYANDLLYKGKPLYIEFPIKKNDSPDKLAKEIKRIANKYMLFMFQDNILDILITSTAAQEASGGSEAVNAVGKVKFVGVNGYQLIKKAVLLVFDPNLVTIDCCSTQPGYVDKIVGVPVTYTIDGDTLTAGDVYEGIDENGDPVTRELDKDTEVAILPGIEAFCDYNWIIHNLRLPTLANTHFWAPTKEDMPAVGGKYTQFTIKMSVDNVGIAGEAVGQRHTSTTTHVLYVLGEYDSSSDSPAKTVYTQLSSLISGTSVSIDTSAETQFENPYGLS